MQLKQRDVRCHQLHTAEAHCNVAIRIRLLTLQL
jgi:hypothetical protein